MAAADPPQAADPALEAWLALGRDLPPGVIRAVLADVDGVITEGEGRPADLRVLQGLSDWNARAQRDPLAPAVTLCTGRPAPYVELLAQTIGAFLPCSFEHGAGLFLPRAFRYLFHPSLGPAYAANLARLRAALEEPVLRPRLGFVQPGKEASVTLYPYEGADLDRLMAAAARAVEPLGGAFSVAANVTGVELRPTGMDKGVGARWIAHEAGVPLACLAGVGDSDPDLVFLALTGWSAAPGNATPAVRAAVHYVAARPFGDGLLEILEQIAAANRQRA